jgi:hypothetical protein
MSDKRTRDAHLAVVALVIRMRDINTELTKRLGDLRRKRPRSETLGRLERQLACMFAAIAGSTKPGETPAPPPSDAGPRPTIGARRPAEAITPAAGRCRHIWSVCLSPTKCPWTCGSAPSAVRR